MRSTCYVWHPQICSRYYDHGGTRSRICISEEKNVSSFRTSARLRTQEGRNGGKGGGRGEGDGRSRFSCENATRLFLPKMVARAETRKSEERGEGGSSLREKSVAQEKKNRRSVGKRNYRLMRRSFRHVGFERESAIGRCFFAEVIRVFARSLSSSLCRLSFSLVRALAPTLSSSSMPHESLHDISTSRRLLESTLGHYLQIALG